MSSPHTITGNVAAGIIDGLEELVARMEERNLAMLANGDIDNPAEWVRNSGQHLADLRRARALIGSLADINEGRSRA